MPTVARDVGMGCGRGAVIYLVAVAIGVPLGICGVLSTLAIVTTFDFAPWSLVAVGLLWLGPFVVAAVVFAGVVLRRKAKLDAMFVPLGLAGTAYLSFFRQYHGTVYGRQMDVYLRRGPFLDIETATPARTRLGITQYQSDTSFFADLAGKQSLAFASPALAGLSVYALDEQWTRALLADTAAVQAVRRLTALGSTVFTRQQVIVRPGALCLMLSGNRRLFGIDITPEQARMWTDDLVRILNVIDALPSPQITDEISSAELFSFKLRDQNPYFALWAGLAILGFFVVAAIVIFIAVFAFTG